jgi:MFS family permease
MIVASRATGFATMLAVLVAGGLGNGLVQPAAGLLIAAKAPARRRSLAAGLVGAALGAGTLVPGLLVALVVGPHGWRAAMLVAGVVALVPVAFAPLTRIPRVSRPAGSRRSGAGGAVLALWALAAALSAAGNNAVASYFVQLGTHSGMTSALAGNLLSASAVVAIAVRIAAGALTDRAPHRNPTVIAAMMLVGGVGLVLVAIGNPVAFALGALLAFSAGWGWTGLLLATALRLVPDRAENAGYIVQVGVYTGATVAPFTFGAASSAFGFPATTIAAAVAAVAAAGAMVGGMVVQQRAARRALTPLSSDFCQTSPQSGAEV